MNKRFLTIFLISLACVILTIALYERNANAGQSLKKTHRWCAHRGTKLDTVYNIQGLEIKILATRCCSKAMMKVCVCARPKEGFHPRVVQNYEGGCPSGWETQSCTASCQ